MARGFWTGLLHGGVLSAAALAVLAILVPVSAPPVTEPESPDPAAAVDAGPPADPAPTDPAPVPTSAASQPEFAADPAPPAATDRPGSERPEAPSVDLPVGSEFARGGDIPPQLPAPLSRLPDRMGQADAPAVSAPAAEPAPVAVTADDARPETSDTGSIRAASEGPEAVEGADVTRPEALGLPELPSLPGFAGEWHKV